MSFREPPILNRERHMCRESIQRYFQFFGPDETFFVQSLPEGNATGSGVSFCDTSTVELLDKIEYLNKSQGVFICVNSLSSCDRRATNVDCVRVLFVDLDGSDLDGLRQAELKPHLIVETSPNHFHGYWFLQPGSCDLNEFSLLQKSLAVRFGGDPKVCDLPRLMRIPGTVNRKRDVPFETRMIEENNIEVRYEVSEITERLGLLPIIREMNGIGSFSSAGTIQKQSPIQKLKSNGLKEGERNDGLFREACRLVELGLDKEELRRTVLSFNNDCCHPPLEKSEVQRLVHSATSNYRSSRTNITGTLGQDVELDLETFHSLILNPPPLPEEIIPGLLHKSQKAFLIGKAKSRKTYFQMQLAMTIAFGGSFLGFENGTPRRVLFVQLEVQRAFVARRFARMASSRSANDKTIDNLLILNGRGLVSKLGAAEFLSAVFVRAIQEKIEVVFIDPLYKLIEGNENSAEDMRPLLLQLDQFAEENMAVILTHHDTKGMAGDRDDVDRGSGSSIVARDYDTGMFLTSIQTRDEQARARQSVLSFVLRNHPGLPPRVIEFENGQFHARDDLVPRRRTSQSERAQAPTPDTLESEYLPRMVEYVQSRFKSGEKQLRLTTDLKRYAEGTLGLSERKSKDLVQLLKSKHSEYGLAVRVGANRAEVLVPVCSDSQTNNHEKILTASTATPSEAVESVQEGSAINTDL